jgi:undecaprenyl diphosphate synthase
METDERSGQPAKLNKKKLPRHVGIIMDGNGRWALKRKKPRFKGHVEGLEAAKRVVQTASAIGLRYLSVFAFSTENWRRTEKEVNYLMFLVKKHLKKEYAFYRANRIRLVHSGDIEKLPKAIAGDIIDIVRDTAGFDGMTLNIALNYGGRDEILRAIAKSLLTGRGGKPLTEKTLARFLDQPNFPDPDLIIRTGGEKRLSNFLLWQGAYAELYFSDKLWPDWSGDDLIEAIHDYQQRERRFGSVS